MLAIAVAPPLFVWQPPPPSALKGVMSISVMLRIASFYCACGARFYNMSMSATTPRRLAITLSPMTIVISDTRAADEDFHGLQYHVLYFDAMPEYADYADTPLY
jgi:hypothetical protein